MRWIFVPLFLAGPLAAEECPAAPDHVGALSDILGEISVAPDEVVARDLSAQLWELWSDAPDERAQELLDRGMSRRAAYDFVEAFDALNRLVSYCPNYAEGYNQRAFVSYLRQDFAAALPDLDRALELSPRHIGALSGRALTHIGLGQKAKARADLLAALKLNPWLSERGLLPSLAPDGTDL